MLHQACQQLATWKNDPRFAHCSIAVNVSAKQFHQADFVETVNAVAQQWQINPMLLKLELTESLLVENLDHAIQKMGALCAIGVRFSLDDFGTGYSSLSYLKKLPLEQIKIDRSFVTDILTDGNDAMIACAIISLAHNMKFSVVAEGVEVEAQWHYLREQHCDIGQGYFFSRPLPSEALSDLMDSTINKHAEYQHEEQQ
jgi:EAL domain-containing protein (putative c-di-GMP-specific phosphodiesterase class I)